MCLGDLSIFILKHIRARAVDHADASPRRVSKPGSMLARFDAAPSCFDADQFHLVICDKPAEDTNRIRPAAHTGDDHIWQPPHIHHHLFARLPSDHGLELAHDRWIRMRTQCRTEQIMRIAHIRNPIADRFVDGILQGLRPGRYRAHFRPEQFHPEHIRLLPRDVNHTHVDDTLEAQQCSHGGRGNAVLTGACLGNDTFLPHPLDQQCLPERVVDLVRARVG